MPVLGALQINQSMRGKIGKINFDYHGGECTAQI